MAQRNKYHFKIYGTQGGGIVKPSGTTQYEFVEVPAAMDFKVGDLMPDHWIIEDIPCPQVKVKREGFSPACFPKGTVCETYHTHSKEIITVTTTGLSKNGPDSYVIHTSMPGDCTDFFGCNIDWVSRIIKRGPGVATLDRDHDVEQRRADRSITKRIDLRQ